MLQHFFGKIDESFQWLIFWSSASSIFSYLYILIISTFCDNNLNINHIGIWYQQYQFNVFATMMTNI